ncbi:hypothetical protein MWU65_16285 [Cellulophaga sp. F20128]|uniref:Kelch repeat-containing protein n=1 Tax=Cellulophaga sp. F20128 TaxID=2926413 RepID=UPI001FF6BD36|nr:kelch repeat-containing protein [Cellulophaga sp. F20128]MCK0158752.1 hypothetical protein [Cellulophaga sp. F20128]
MKNRMKVFANLFKAIAMLLTSCFRNGENGSQETSGIECVIGVNSKTNVRIFNFNTSIDSNKAVLYCCQKIFYNKKIGIIMREITLRKLENSTKIRPMKTFKIFYKNSNITKLAFTVFFVIINFACSKDDAVAPNKAPTAFTLKAVTDGAIGVDLKPTFSWNAPIDPDGDTITYQLFMDENSDPTTSIVSSINGASFTVEDRLPLNKKLFWKVVASDTQGNTSSSNTFSFTTRNLKIPATAVTANANFSARLWHTSVVFKDNMWVIGGYDGNWLNDVWQSNDGISWTQITTTSPFSARHGHTVVVFNNKIWVIGGSDGNRLNDVWQSSDGISWTQVTADAPFSERSSHTSVIFNDKMWVIGGSDGNRLNDVWQSSDGVTWAQVITNAPFSGRTGHTSVVFENKMWIIGGSDGPTNLNDVWQSSDGVTWAQVTADAAFPVRNGLTSVVFDDKMWIIGGQNETTRINDVWHSSDGQMWFEVLANTTFPERTGHTSVVFNDKIWTIGGFGGEYLKDVWVMD